MKIKTLIYLLAASLFASCVESPENPVDNGGVENASSAAFILCEGLWNYDNSSITRYSFEGASAGQDIFKKANPGLRLGDTANDIIISGDTVYVAVSVSGSIESFDAKSGAHLGRIILENTMPRRMALKGDFLYATDSKNDRILVISRASLTLINEYATGPAPEGIGFWNGLLFAANSGAGDYRKGEPGAGTISVINASSGALIDTVPAGPNAYGIIIDENKGALFVKYLHLYSQQDSLGGIIEYSLPQVKEKRRWRDRITSIASSMEFSSSGDTLLYLNDKGVGAVSLNDGEKFQLIDNTGGDFWNSLATASDGGIWIGNAKNYQVEGEALKFSPDNYMSPEKIIPCGINPVKIVFY